MKQARLAILASGLVLCLFAMYWLSNDVLSRLRTLNEAQSDSAQWTLYQIQADHTLFELALVEAIASDDGHLRETRERFDLFYSRVNILQQSPMYQSFKSDPDYGSALMNTQRFLDDTVVLIDGDDEKLKAALPKIANELRSISGDVRSLTLQGLHKFTAIADYSRNKIFETMRLLALTTIVLIGVLLLLSFYMMRLYNRSENAAKEQRSMVKQLETFMSTSLDAIVVANQQGQVLHYNGAAEKIFGYTEVEAIGRTIEELMVPEKHVVAHRNGMRRFNEKGERRLVDQGLVQIEAKRKSGQLFPAELSIAQIERPDGIYFISYIRDITERTKTDAELIRARDLALIGEKTKAEFLAVMSHEMRTPLNGLMGSVTLLQDQRLNVKQRKLVQNIAIAGDAVLQHIEDVIDITSFDSNSLDLHKTEFDLKETLETLISGYGIMAAERGNSVSLDWQLDAETCVVGDRARIRQIISKLLNNAVKFTTKGDITISVQATRQTVLQRHVLIKVRDTGIGIPRANLRNIFNDFVIGDAAYSRTHQGIGLGLSLAKRLTQALGGKIGVESEEGVGSTFWVSVPLGRVNAEETSSTKHKVVQPAFGKSILIAEDNQINRDILRELLEAAGHRVTEAADGQQAINYATHEKFDLILMDISMPKADGTTATREIRASKTGSFQTPIIAVTAHNLPSEIVSFREAGMDDVIIKPINRAHLLDKVNQYAGKVAQGDQSNIVKVDFNKSKGDMTIINTEYLMSLFEDLGNEQLHTLIKKFIHQTDESVVQMLANDGRNMPLDELVSELHKLAGSAGAMGATQLHRKLSELQTAGKQGNEVYVRDGLASLNNIWRASKAELEGLITTDKSNKRV